MPELTNPRAERVKAVRALAGRPARSRSGRFLVEGPQAVREAVRADHVRVHDLYVTDAAAARYDEILAAATARGIVTRIDGMAAIDTVADQIDAILKS